MSIHVSIFDFGDVTTCLKELWIHRLAEIKTAEKYGFDSLLVDACR